ncbi:dual 3',5'-cyclic-AMP and -GMP phosphodiesterase 11 isoform X1 [Octopus sinensis]|uniref:Phosphodiesterase n=2 Tax=Octopus sinensis TaxID=2607531 RepID=A0A7E6EP88_9MOLL|nr:dual 3',5'-cyclic-AMP and -GMP phosphodiesterase 11 isoform X1 [Octopus sinensis]
MSSHHYPYHSSELQSAEDENRLPSQNDGNISEKEEYERMERWLDAHPQFCHNYFVRKAQRQTVDEWLFQQSESSWSAGQSENPTGSRSNSGSNTPVRKISTQELDRGSLLNPMVSTVDGTPTFLAPYSNTNQSVCQPQTKLRRRSRSELQALDEKELMYELVKDASEELDVTCLCFKILQNVCILLNADCCSLFLVQYNYAGEKMLVSKLFDVSSSSNYEQCRNSMEEIRIEWGTGIIGYVAKTGERLNIPDAYQDPRFNYEIDQKTGYKTHSILSMPIKDRDGEVIGVAQTVNKFSGKDEPFDVKDEKIFTFYLAFCGIGLKNAQQYEKSLLENRRNQVLLDLARVIFEDQHTVANLIHKIMMHTLALLKCEVCQVMLVQDCSKDGKKRINGKMGIFSDVFELHATDVDKNNQEELSREPRYPINIGITGHVATTGDILNIPNAYADCRFDPSSDEDARFKTRSILCMPIKNATGQIIGVSQLINKSDRTPFNKNDEHFFEAFAIFCGMGIDNTQMYEKAVKAIARQQVSLEVLSYHATASGEEAEKLKSITVPTSSDFNLLDYNFNDFTLDDDNTLQACVRMFLDLGFLQRFQIRNDVLCRWLLSVKKNYRNVTYHNWRHAFNVTQTMFCMIKTGEMGNILTPSEQIALIVATLCHDLDHRGQNNQFQIKAMTPLAQLYSTSTLEHHHFDQCIMILNTKGNDILSNISQDEYRNIVRVLEGSILATDLALYFRNRTRFFNLVNQEESCDWTNEDSRELLQAMMMTACDVSAITKPWEIQQEIAKLVASEFFEQGDIERQQWNITPISMMDRDKQDELPSMQVSFIDAVCLPVYRAISKISPKLKPLQDGCEENRRQWQRLSDERKITKDD